MANRTKKSNLTNWLNEIRDAFNKISLTIAILPVRIKRLIKFAFEDSFHDEAGRDQFWPTDIKRQMRQRSPDLCFVGPWPMARPR